MSEQTTGSQDDFRKIADSRVPRRELLRAQPGTVFVPANDRIKQLEADVSRFRSVIEKAVQGCQWCRGTGRQARIENGTMYAGETVDCPVCREWRAALEDQ